MKVIEAFKVNSPIEKEDYKESVEINVTLHHSANATESMLGSIGLRAFFDYITKYMIEDGITQVETNIIIALYREDTGDESITILLTDTPKSAKGEEEFAYIAFNDTPAIGY